MFTTAARRSFLLATLALTFAATGCVLDETSAADRAIIETPCAATADCPAGFECEIEVEHGVTTSFCQADEDSGGVCPAGYEAEIEHGQLFCQPHGGGGGGGGSGSGSGGNDGGVGDDDGGTGTGPVGAACASNADCAAGLECEVEIEHGQTVSSCQPHGGV